MEIFLWIIGALILFLPGWFFLKVVIGVVISPKITGRLFFRKQLKKAGISPSTLGDKCVEEIFPYVYKAAKASHYVQKSSGENRTIWFRTVMVDQIDATITGMNHMFYLQSRDKLRSESYILFDPVAEILKKHGHLKEK